jgi:hypothetical protein
LLFLEKRLPIFSLFQFGPLNFNSSQTIKSNSLSWNRALIQWQCFFYDWDNHIKVSRNKLSPTNPNKTQNKIIKLKRKKIWWLKAKNKNKKGVKSSYHICFKKKRPTILFSNFGHLLSHFFQILKLIFFFVKSSINPILRIFFITLYIYIYKVSQNKLSTPNLNHHNITWWNWKNKLITKKITKIKNK